jgi:MFS family permease
VSSASPNGERVRWDFIVLYTLAFLGTCLVLIAPLLVTLALKVNSLVGIDAAPRNLSVVTGVGALVAMVGNPFLGKLSDRTTSRLGMRRPWMVIGLAGGSVGVLLVAVAPNVPVVLAGWCVAQLFFNGLLAALVAVLPDQVPVSQRGLVSGMLGVCLPIASVCGTFVVDLFSASRLAMFLAPCAVATLLVTPFLARLDDRRLAVSERPPWSMRELLDTFYVDPRRNPDFTWAFASRFLFVTAYAFLITYQAYFLIERVGSDEDDIPRLIFHSTVVQSAFVVVASLVGGRLSDRTGRRKVFVLTASLGYGLALLFVAGSTDFDRFLVGMAIAGLAFGVYVAVDLALVADVLPDGSSIAKDLGVFNMAGALPFSVAPAVAPFILSLGGGSYGLLYGVAGGCAVLGALAILPVRRVR